MSRSGLDGAIVEHFGHLWCAHLSSILRWEATAMSMRRRRASHGRWSTVPITGWESRRRRPSVFIEIAHASRHRSAWVSEDSVFVVNDDTSSLAGVAGISAGMLMLVLVLMLMLLVTLPAMS